MTAQIAFQASENSATRAQQSSERSMQEENKRARDQFLRDQRISAYKQFLTDSRLLVDAQLDYYNALSQPRLYTPDQTRAYLSDMRVKWRQFVSSAWGLEFFSPEKVRESATNLSEELLARHDMLENYDYSNAAFERLAARVNETATKISDLRQKFADAASEVLSS